MSGELRVLEDLADAMEGLPYRLLRKGDVYPKRRQRVQPANVLVLDLAHWERGAMTLQDWETVTEDERPYVASPEQLAEEQEQLAKVSRVLDRLIAPLGAIEPSQARARLSIGIVLTEDNGFELPAELIAFAAAGGLSIDHDIYGGFDIS